MAPRKRKQSSVTNVKHEETVVVQAEATVDPSTPPRTRRAPRKSPKKIAIASEENIDTKAAEIAEPETPTPKKRRRTKVVEPVVYDIVPVEHKPTAFKGRLGYACLNTILRVSKPEPIFCSRTCRIATILKEGLDFAKELGRKNCIDLCKVIQWNEDNNIKFFRMSSEMFPFASHSIYGYTLEYAAKELKAAGDLAKRYGHRLTTHPGQFTQLASPNDAVVTASIRELDYHCQIMRYMGLDQHSVIILHMGGMYGDKESAVERFKQNYTTRLTDEMKARLVLENDEMCYNADELLPVCNELNIPIVLDYHHNWINPSVHPVSELISLIEPTWRRKGIKPKQHLSDPRPGAITVMEKRAHADRCASLPDDLPVDMDLMIEAKDKEQAVFQLYRVYNLAPVIHENLRPEKPPKPFIHEEVDELADEEDGAPRGESASPRAKRARRSNGRNEELSTDADKETNQGIAVPSPVYKRPKTRGSGMVGETLDSSTPHANKNSKGSAVKRGKRASHRTAAHDHISEFVNQEEAVIPVDGASIDAVERDEHPEAAVVPEGACGVGETCDGSTKKRKRKRSSSQRNV